MNRNEWAIWGLYLLIMFGIAIAFATIPPVSGTSQIVKQEPTRQPDVVEMAREDLKEGAKMIQKVREEIKQAKPKVVTKTVYKEKVVKVKPKVAILVEEGKVIELQPTEYKGYYVIDLESLNIKPDTIVITEEFRDDRNLIQRILNKKPKNR